ncbi:thap domain-containing protein 9 [Lasius niger]|uniref:Thap domain-containing protein 9 n=1 Tax=Lasius niger TaxID=67767 RepID=A0A0J7K4D9_LASNI|nr:thap domain-containing protein 9 [Lasius niger]
MLMKSMNVLKRSCNKKNKIINRLRVQHCRQKKKIESLEALLHELYTKDLLSSTSSDTVKAVVDESTILKQIEEGKVKGTYSSQLRAFALTVNFYSPKAYNYIRQVFQNKLQAPSTWYSSTNESPGFTKEAVGILKRKSEAVGNNKLYACLTMDEMAIRQQIQWSSTEERFIGYVDHGLIIQDSEDLPIVKEALVYLITCMNQRWKIPVAYFFVARLTAEERAEIIRKVLEFIAPSGVIVNLITFDGLPANISMCKHLGADILNHKSFFKHPTEGYNIFIYMDAAHMLKLIRNAFA